MKTIRAYFMICTLALVFSIPVLADGKGHGKSGKSASGKAKSGPTAVHEIAPGKETVVGPKVIITANERQVIQNYVKSVSISVPPGNKAKALPPGLTKKVGRGGELPPGWQKKCIQGETMPLEVFKVCHPLPKEVIVKLPAPPPGTVLVAVEGKVVRLHKADSKIMDVFDLP